MIDFQARTLPLPGGKRTSFKFDPVTWRAVDLLAARAGVKWTRWVRDLIASLPSTENIHAAIRAAAMESLMQDQLLGERAEQATEGRRPVLLEGCTMMNEAQLEEELAAGQVDGDIVDLVAFEVLVGLDQHKQPTIWIRNGLRGSLSLAITLPFSADEVAAKKGSFA